MRDPVFLTLTAATPDEPEPEPDQPDPDPVDDMHPDDRRRMNEADGRLAKIFLGRGPAQRHERDVAGEARRRLELLARVAELAAVPEGDRDARWTRRWESLLAAVDSEVALSHNTNR